MSQLVIKIKKLFRNKIFLNIGGYTLAFAIGLFLASYVAEKQQMAIQSKQNQTKQQEVNRNKLERSKPFGRRERVALPADQLPPVPIRAHAVELFAHRPACNVLVFVFLRQHQIRAERRLDEKSGKNRYHALH